MSKAKFKVGDKVRILDGYDKYPWFVSTMKCHVGEVHEISSSSQLGKFHMFDRNPFAWGEECLELVTETPNWKVVIIPDGDKTTGKLYNGDKVVKEVSTVKSPHDEYNMEEAIKVICERLTGKTEKKEEPPKLYNGKVVCVENNPSNVGFYTVGKIYEVVNGKFVNDKGDITPICKVLHDFNDLQRFSVSKWIEVVE